MIDGLPDTAKPTTARDTRKPASKSEQLGGQLDLINNPERLQVARLLRRFAVSAATAGALAPLIFGDALR